MSTKYPDTFYEAVLEAIEGDGKFTLQGFDTKRYSDRFDALRSVSQWGWRTTCPFSDILYSGNSDNSRVRKAMNRIMSHADSTITVCLYESLRIPEKERSISTLKAFATFLDIYRDILEIDCEVFFQIFNEHSPAGASWNFRFDEDEGLVTPEQQAEFNKKLREHLNEFPVVENWLHQLGRDLSKFVGRWSMTGLSPESVIKKTTLIEMYRSQKPELFNDQ